MAQPRVAETDHGIEGEFMVTTYDAMQRRMRDKGWMRPQDIVDSGITSGHALEIGPGPGYLGLEWLKRSQDSRLTGLDISADMIAVAERNADEYGMGDRVEYVHSSGNDIPFDAGHFDAVFTSNSLHEWADPRGSFEEIWRVLKPGGRLFISDLRRDMFFLIRWFIWINTQPKEIRTGFLTSVRASYTPDELREMIRDSSLKDCQVSGNLIGLTLTGEKG